MVRLNIVWFVAGMGKKQCNESELALAVAVQDFPPDREAVAAVRELVCQVAGVDPDHPAVLVASELATNAIVDVSPPIGWLSRPMT